MEEQQHEVRQLADRLAEMLLSRGVGGRSRWALRTALDAAETGGVAGMMCIAISGKGKDHLDVSFTVGEVDLITRWSA